MDYKKESDVLDYVNQKQLLSVTTDGSCLCALCVGFIIIKCNNVLIIMWLCVCSRCWIQDCAI